MNLLALSLAVILSQTPPAAAPAVVTPDTSSMNPADRAALAAEKAAIAAEKASQAVQRLAEIQAGPAMPVAAVATAVDPWHYNIGLGLSFVTGNAESITFTGNAGVDKKFGGWKWGARFNGAYGNAKPKGAIGAQLIALNGLLSTRLDRDVTDFLSIYAQVGASTDHVRALEARINGELGVGFTILNKKVDDLEKLYLRLDLSLLVLNEWRFDYLALANRNMPDVFGIGPRAGATFRYSFNKYIKFSEELSVIPHAQLIRGDAVANYPAVTPGWSTIRLLLNSNTKLAARLTEYLSLTTALIVAHDTIPAPGLVNTDVTLTAGIEATF